MKIFYKIIFINILVFTSSIIYAQRPSTEVVQKEKYTSNTKWSCIDKHYGYYFINYSMPIPLTNDNIELEGASGKLKLGYSYRYKIAKTFDIGIELNYSRYSTRIDPKTLATTTLKGAENPSKHKIADIGHSAEGGLFFRFNFGKSDYRHLGYHIDLGATYSYDISHILKDVKIFEYATNNTKVKEKEHLKDYKFKQNYGAFLRFGKDNFAFICSYNFADWSYENKRSPLLIGIQINLYTR